jgi:hypothetical protein
MQLYVNVSNAKQATSRRSIRLSVRVQGIECGVVTVGAPGVRVFEPRNRQLFGSCDADAAEGREWGDAAVARYIRASAATPVRGRPEAGIESALILKMKRSDGEWRGEQQPVCLAGLPFQVPLPVTGSGGSYKLGDGRIDVLARLGRGGKGLRVYELKAPDASVDEVRGALDQAVTYVAALKYLLTQGGTSRPWWTLIGFRGQPARRPNFEAFAVVADTSRNRETMQAARDRLGTANSQRIKLGVLCYTRTPSGGLEIRAC